MIAADGSKLFVSSVWRGGWKLLERKQEKKSAQRGNGLTVE
jgi:hypothetical protein